MKKVPTNESSQKMKAVHASVVPFKEKREGDSPDLEIDSNKLGALWAASADALNTVGDGFENVIVAINALIDDNQEARQDNKRTRKVVYLGLFLMLIFGAVTMQLIKSTVDSATVKVSERVSSQLEAMTSLKEESMQLRESTLILSRMQASSIEAQVAGSAAGLAEGDEDIQLLAARKVLEAEVSLARGRIQLAETPQERKAAKKSARVVVKRARKEAGPLGPVEIEKGASDPLSDL